MQNSEVAKKEWDLESIIDLHNGPLLDLVFRAAQVHRAHHNAKEVQISTLLSIKTGGCPEDCAYCPQAARYFTDIETNALMSEEQVLQAANRAQALGASRLCMGAAWRNVKDDKDFDHVLGLVKAVNGLNMEVCCTLGMLSESQAKKLAEAGLYAYNHNLDTSEDYYKEIISTRGFDDRLKTLDNVRKANLTVCSGGIIGMGESVEDRCQMLLTLSKLNPQPESVPVNALVPVEGTPMENAESASIWEMIRMIATTRIVMPKTVVRLSAGRTEMSVEGQALCFLAGAGSIFAGDKLLTTPNPEVFQDLEMFNLLGLKPKAPFSTPMPEDGEQAAGKQTSNKEQEWSRPNHHIPANIEYAKMGKEKRQELRQKARENK